MWIELNAADQWAKEPLDDCRRKTESAQSCRGRHVIAAQQHLRITAHEFHAQKGDAGFVEHRADGGRCSVDDGLWSPQRIADDVAFARHLVEKIGVACIPCSAFYAPGDDGTKDREACSLVRFAFCKTDETIRAAGARMRALQPASR